MLQRVSVSTNGQLCKIPGVVRVGDIRREDMMQAPHQGYLLSLLHKRHQGSICNYSSPLLAWENTTALIIDLADSSRPRTAEQNHAQPLNAGPIAGIAPHSRLCCLLMDTASVS